MDNLNYKYLYWINKKQNTHTPLALFEVISFSDISIDFFRNHVISFRSDFHTSYSLLRRHTCLKRFVFHMCRSVIIPKMFRAFRSIFPASTRNRWKNLTRSKLSVRDFWLYRFTLLDTHKSLLTSGRMRWKLLGSAAKQTLSSVQNTYRSHSVAACRRGNARCELSKTRTSVSSRHEFSVKRGLTEKLGWD